MTNPIRNNGSTFLDAVYDVASASVNKIAEKGTQAINTAFSRIGYFYQAIVNPQGRNVNLMSHEVTSGENVYVVVSTRENIEQ